MFLISLPMLWNLNYFFLFFYIIFIISLILYILPNLKTIINSSKFNTNNNFEYINGPDVHWLNITPIVLLFVINLAWSNYSTSSWFSNLIFSSFQYKITFLILLIFLLIIIIYNTSFYFSSKEIFDFLITCFNFLIWTIFIFFSNTIFVVIFFIEIISTLIFLILITSSFSTTKFYNNLNLNLHIYFNSTTPMFFIQMLMYFFWISLISSLNLFFFLILFYLKFLTFDWFVFEFIFFYLMNLNQSKDVFFVFMIWFNLLFSIFLKCGLVPFYFWKPTFFKGMPLHALLFYIIFFYFFILLFFIYFLLIYLNELFFFFSLINICLLFIGIFILLFILCEAYYIKAFLAISSILNTLFIFIALNGTNLINFVFII